MAQGLADRAVLETRLATLEAQLAHYQAAFAAISEGVCSYDRDQRLIFANAPYAEIYRLAPTQLTPGMSLRKVVELRFAAGTCPTSVDDYLASTLAINDKREARDWIVTLKDGRAIRIRYRPMPDEGGISTHEDVTTARERRLLIEERVSLQSLIDTVPDNLWVKDAESRFVIANRATALRMGYSRSQDLVGKSDRELCPWETAQKFLADERRVIESGRPMIDSEEYVLDANGEKLWIATTKAPLRNEGGDVVGVTGVSRDITRRRLAEALREGQAGIIEMIVGGAPAPDVLAELADLVESQSHGAVASIILASGEQPRVGEVTQRAIQDRRAALLAGPLQPAIHDGETVIVPDIATDPAWRDHRAFFLKHGVRGCWATPISSRSGTPLGVLGIFAHSVREPDESELKLMQMAAQLASIAIERAA